MKTLILGCGRQGSILARMLVEQGIQVTVIDKNPEAFGRLENFNGRKILGDGIMESTLLRAGLKECDAFVAVTNSDNVNLMAAQIARGIHQVGRVLCRIYDPRRAAIYSDLGLETVNFSLMGAHLLRSGIVEAGLVKKYQLGDGSALAVEIKISGESTGKKVSEVEIPGEFRISSIIRNLRIIIPESDTRIKDGDHLFGVVKVERLSDLLLRLEAGPIKTSDDQDTGTGGEA